MGEGCRFEEAGKHVEIPDQPLVYDFLLKVEVEVCPEHCLRLLSDGIAHEGNHPKLERVLKVEVVPHFRGEERVAKAFHGASPKEIGALGALEFPRAGTREDETLVPVLLDKIMNRVEQIGDALDLIDDNGILVGVRLHDADKTFRVRRQGPAHIGLKEIDDKRIWKLMTKPHRFSCAARPKKEETAAWKPYHSLFHGMYDIISLMKMQL